MVISFSVFGLWFMGFPDQEEAEKMSRAGSQPTPRSKEDETVEVSVAYAKSSGAKASPMLTSGQPAVPPPVPLMSLPVVVPAEKSESEKVAPAAVDQAGAVGAENQGNVWFRIQHAIRFPFFLDVINIKFWNASRKEIN
jgi:hypothetical protein